MTGTTATNPADLREQGNQAFKQAKYQDAIDRYSEALNALSDLSLSESIKGDLTKCYSNRAQCYMNLNQYEEAIEDATRGEKIENEQLGGTPSSFSTGIYTCRSEITLSSCQCLRTSRKSERGDLRRATTDLDLSERRFGWWTNERSLEKTTWKCTDQSNRPLFFFTVYLLSSSIHSRIN